MGMLFNTESTLEILRLVNNAFSVDGLRKLRFEINSGTGKSQWLDKFNKMGTSGHDTYTTVASPLDIDLDIGRGNSHRSSRWKRYLSYLDSTNVSGTAQTVANQIGGFLITAINDTSYDAVEFFAVPSTNATASVVVNQSNLQNLIGINKIMIITVTTTVVDLMPL